MKPVKSKIKEWCQNLPHLQYKKPEFVNKFKKELEKWLNEEVFKEVSSNARKTTSTV